MRKIRESPHVGCASGEELREYMGEVEYIKDVMQHPYDPDLARSDSSTLTCLLKRFRPAEEEDDEE